MSISSRHRVVPNNVFKFLNRCTRELITRKNREKIYWLINEFSLWRLWFSKRFGANHYFICSVRAMQPFTRQYGNTGLQTDIYSQIVDESLHNVPLNNHRATEYNLWSMKKSFLCQSSMSILRNVPAVFWQFGFCSKRTSEVLIMVSA